MSKHRIDPRAGHSNGKLQPCRECGKMPVPPRRTFCSDECVTNWKMRTQPGFAAIQVLKRDGGVCVECKLDCVTLKTELHRLINRAKGHRLERPWGYLPEAEQLAAIELMNSRIAELGLKGTRASGNRRLWEMDHILPVVEGGGLCGLDNLRTLCWKCHAVVTAALRKRMSVRKKEPSTEKPDASHKEGP